MHLSENPITSVLHADWRKRIKIHFSQIDFSNSIDYLCLIKYIDNAPQKFYSNEAFQKYFQFLETTKKEDPEVLSKILKESETLLSISTKSFLEVLSEPIHDILLPDLPNDLINFIDNKIHYNLLKLYETPLFQFGFIIAKYHWIKQEKGLDRLDLYNVIDQLKKVGFDFIEPFYLHNIRNGIAHGKIIFSDSDITYFDKKGNKEKISTRKIVKTFDGIIDIINGFCLAFKVFCFTNSTFFDRYNISIPKSILLEELQSRSNCPGWTITNCIESIVLSSKRQLTIYVKNDNWDFNKVRTYSFLTALWAEKLTKSYERIFISLYSANSTVHSGWAAYDGLKFKELRELQSANPKDFKGVLEGDLVFFIPKFKFPWIIYRLGTYQSVFKVLLPLELQNFKDKFRYNPFLLRETRIHSKKNFSVISDPSIIVRPSSLDDVEALIINNRKKIFQLAVKKSRQECHWLSITKYLPVRYIRVFVYDTNKRIRDLRSSGLIPELIASIEVNTTKKIKTIDIADGIPEQHGKYRVVWNRKWNGFDDKFNQ